MGLIGDIFSRGKAGNISLGKNESYLVTFNLSGKTSLDKVKFCQALFGRNKGDGILEEAKGKKLGPGCVLVPSGGIGEIEKFMGEQKARIQKQKIVLVE